MVKAGIFSEIFSSDFDRSIVCYIFCLKIFHKFLRAEFLTLDCGYAMNQSEELKGLPL